MEQSPPLIKMYKEPKGIVRWLAVQQVLTLLRELPLHQMLMKIFALCVGLRQGNVKRLKWVQIDMQACTMRVDADSTTGEDHIGALLNSMAMDVLHQCVGKHPEYVFTYKGQPVTQVNTRAWRNALKRGWDHEVQVPRSPAYVGVLAAAARRVNLGHQRDGLVEKRRNGGSVRLPHRRAPAAPLGCVEQYARGDYNPDPPHGSPGCWGKRGGGSVEC